MYEKYGFSARLSYNWRGRYTPTIQNRGDDIYYERVDPISRLDLSTSYTINSQFTVFGDWTNILKKPFRSQFSSARAGAPRAEYPRFVRYEETTLSAGIRFNFAPLAMRSAPASDGRPTAAAARWSSNPLPSPPRLLHLLRRRRRRASAGI